MTSTLADDNQLRTFTHNANTERKICSGNSFEIAETGVVRKTPEFELTDKLWVVDCIGPELWNKLPVSSMK